MKKAAVLVEDHYQVLEVWYPYLRLRENGIRTVFVGPGRQKTYMSKEGYPVEEELPIKEAKIEDFDVVVIPGGYAQTCFEGAKILIALSKICRMQANS